MTQRTPTMIITDPVRSFARRRWRHAGHVVLCALLTAGAPLRATAQRPPQSPRGFLQLQAGALNPDDPFATTAAWGAAIGWQSSSRAYGLQVRKQSPNGNATSDLTSDARTFVSLAIEQYLGTPREPFARQLFLTADAGFVLRDPWATAPVTGLGIGWRLSLGSRIWLTATFSDEVAWLPTESLACTDIWGTLIECGIPGGPQHNFGGLIAIRLHQ